VQTKLKLLIAAGGIALLLGCGGGGSAPLSSKDFSLPGAINAVPPQ